MEADVSDAGLLLMPTKSSKLPDDPWQFANWGLVKLPAEAPWPYSYVYARGPLLVTGAIHYVEQKRYVVSVSLGGGENHEPGDVVLLSYGMMEEWEAM